MDKGKTFGLACIILIALGTILGLRTQAAVRAVLRSQRLTVFPSQAIAATPLLDGIEAKDELLASAVPGERDPFGDPPVVRRAGTAPDRAPRPPEAPILRAFLYDEVRPSVQLGLGADVSGWLTVGELFQGWRVDEITRTGVKLSQGTQTVLLHSS